MATAASTTPAPPQGLRRELGLASTTSAVIGGIIAVGIFLTPAGMAQALAFLSRMDVPAGYGSRHHRLIGYRPGGIFCLHR